MIHNVADCRKAPKPHRPYTISGTIAAILDTLAPNANTIVGGVITLGGHRVTPRTIRNTVVNVTPPGRSYACRTIHGEQVQIWRVL